MAKAILNGVEINKFVVDCPHTGTGGGLDFQAIGWDGAPQALQDAYDYAKEIYDNWDASVTNRYKAFQYDKKLVFFPAVDTSNVTNMQDMVAESSITYFPSNFNTSNVTNMQYMFGKCGNLQSLDLSSFNTSNVTNMQYMFSGCTNLQSLDLSSFNTSNVTNMQYMFGGCIKLTSLDLSNFDTSKVTSMGGFANNASGLTTFILHGTNTATPLYLKEAFYQCPALSKVEITHITPNNLGATFKDCKALKSLDVITWNTDNLSSVTESINATFTNCNEIEKIDGYINYAKLNKNGYNANYAWQNCSKLRKFEARNMGMHSGMTSCWFYGNYNGMSLWGENSDEIPDARESMINTLITYSFDRASAGYQTCQITLHANAKARLTDDEIAQITAKGFSIS